MRTNIDLDEDLVAEGMKLTNARTKKELVHKALQELVENRRRLDLRELRGKISFRSDYEYKRLRSGDGA